MVCAVTVILVCESLVSLRTFFASLIKNTLFNFKLSVSFSVKFLVFLTENAMVLFGERFVKR